MYLPLDNPDFALIWPKEIFLREYSYLRLHGTVEQVVRLLREAFVTPTLSDRASRDCENSRQKQFGVGEQISLDSIATITELDARLEEIVEITDPKPYFIHRHRILGSDGSSSDRSQLHIDFTSLINEFNGNGFLDHSLGLDCVDSPRDDPSFMLFSLLGIPDLWPLSPAEWSDDELYTLIEVFFDLVAYPRSITYYHSFGDCGPHYADFAKHTGQSLYAHRVNKVLAHHHSEFRLATNGEDTGRLVATTNENMIDLMDKSINQEDEHSTRVRHAASLFRSRSASREDKRAAVRELADILEADKKRLNAVGVGTKDESALFEIANKFAIRHNNRSQQADYRDEFLEWIFWWYLATIQLLRTHARRANVDE